MHYKDFMEFKHFGFNVFTLCAVATIVFTVFEAWRLHKQNKLIKEKKSGQSLDNYLFIYLIFMFVASLVYGIEINSLALIINGCLVLFCVLVLFKDYNTLGNQKKNQIKYFLLGAAISSMGGLLFDAILPWLFKDERFYSIGPIFFIFFVGFTSYAIIKHKLLDIRVVVQRGIIYSSLLSIIIGFYIVSIFILSIIFQQVPTELSIFIAAGITTIFGIYSVLIIEKYFRKITDKIFYKDKYDYPRAVYELSEILNKNIEFEKLIKRLVDKLKKILKVKNVRLIFPNNKLTFDEFGKLRRVKEEFPRFFISSLEQNKNIVLIHSDIPCLIKKAKKEKKGEGYIKSLKLADKYGEKYQIEASVAILLEKKLIGLIALGEKLSGDIYTEEDISLLKTLSYQAAVALEKSRLYKEVKEHSKELEGKVKKRTAKIEGLQKEQKQMMQEISHGLQTPLTILKGELSFLNKEVKDSSKIKSLERSIDRVSAFVYDMLRLAKFEAQQSKDFKKNKLNLSSLLEELVESFEIITLDKKIKINHRIEANIFVMGDKNELEELVSNLTSNSVKYMGSGKVREISISLLKKKDKIELSVADTGAGISEKDLPAIFTRFHRIGDDAHAGKKGTGLGLAICKQIVERHGENYRRKRARRGNYF